MADISNPITINVGNVYTGAPGSNAAVVNTGDERNVVLDFTIPRGDVGPTGPQGTGIKVYVDGESDETILAATKEGDIIMRKVTV